MYLYPVLTYLLAAAVIVQFVFSCLALTPDDTLFDNEFNTIVNKYKLDITPSDWIIALLPIVYVLQVVGLVYLISNIFRSGGSQGYPAYEDPQFIPHSTLFAATVITVHNFLWMWVFTEDNMQLSTMIIWFALAMQVGVITVTGISLENATEELEDDDRGRDVWITRLVILEAMFVQAVWFLSASLYCTGILLVHVWSDWHQDTVTIISQIIFGLLFGIWAVVDMTFLDKYFRYNMAPYLSYILILIAILDNANPTPVLTILLIVIGGVVNDPKVIFPGIQTHQGRLTRDV